MPKKRKWGSLPKSSDAFFDIMLKFLCGVIERTEVSFVKDLKAYESSRGRLSASRVYGYWDIKKDIIKLDVPKSHRNRIRRIVSTALHEAIEKLLHDKTARRHRDILRLERYLMERLTDDQISYVWSLLPELPVDT